MSRKLFCEISPLTYKISEQKGIIIRHFKNLFGNEKIARVHSKKELPNIVKHIKDVANSQNIRIRKLWLDKIPDKIYIDTLYTKYGNNIYNRIEKEQHIYDKRKQCIF